jgi:hypothetical protein
MLPDAPGCTRTELTGVREALGLRDELPNPRACNRMSWTSVRAVEIEQRSANQDQRS